MIRLGKWGEGYITSLEGAKRIVNKIKKYGIFGNIDNQLRNICGKEICVRRDTPWKVVISSNDGDCLKTKEFTNSSMYKIQNLIKSVPNSI